MTDRGQRVRLRRVMPFHEIAASELDPTRPEGDGGRDAAALRDAEAILARAEADEREADRARIRYRETGLPTVEPDADIVGALASGEAVVEVRPAATVGRHAEGGLVETLAGRLYLTTRRLILHGSPLDVDLEAIDELALGGERLLVTLADGTGLTIDAGQPRLLRVQVAAARAAAR